MNATDTQIISVIEPVSKAVEKTKQILFSPFDIGKWFVVGFCAWLAFLGEGGGFNFRPPCGGQSRQMVQQAKDLIAAHLPIIITGVTIGVVIAVAIALLIMWLKSRGQFMFLYCVANNRAEIKIPWRRYGTQANSLFAFRLSLWLISVFCLLPFGVLLVFAVVLLRKDALSAAAGIGLIVIASLMFTALMIAYALVMKFTKDFVVPIMYINGNRCLQAWRQFRQMLSANSGKFTLYILFQIVIAIAIAAIIFIAVVATCCCACCIMAIPYIGTVLLLPVLVFKRAYSLCYLAQYGTAFDVFTQDTPTEITFPEQPLQ